jgi:hypothetical protein
MRRSSLIHSRVAADLALPLVSRSDGFTDASSSSGGSGGGSGKGDDLSFTKVKATPPAMKSTQELMRVL